MDGLSTVEAVPVLGEPLIHGAIGVSGPRELALDVAPMSWPVGLGGEFDQLAGLQRLQPADRGLNRGVERLHAQARPRDLRAA